MHPPFRAILGTALLLAVLSGCDSSSSPTPEPTPGPPASSDLVDGQRIAAALGAGDTARFTIRTDSGRTWRFSLTSDGMLAGATIQGTDDPPLQRHYVTREGLDDSLVFPCDRSGTYTLLIASRRSGSGGRFDLVVSTEDSFPADFQPRDAYEIDGTATKAKLIPDDSSVQSRTLHGFEASPGDVDAIAFMGDSGTTYSLRYRSAVAGATVRAFLPDSSYWSETVTTKSTVAGEEVVTIDVPIEKTAKYHFGVLHAKRVLGYQVALTSKEGLPERMIPDRFENDDVMARATPIATDSAVQRHTIHGNLRSSYDVDWVSFRADSGWTYTLHYTDIKQDGYYGSFYSPESARLATSYNVPDGKRSQIFHARASGTYSLRFQSTQTRVVYDIAITRTQGIPGYAVADSFENDNSASGAKPIAADSSWQSRTLHGWSQFDTNDSDNVVFQAVAGTTYRLYMTDSTGFMRAAAYDANSVKIAGTSVSSGVSYLSRTEFTPTASGPCTIRISTGFKATLYRIALVAAKP